MKIIDLTLELKNGKVWHPDDPYTEIKQFDTIENSGWNTKQIKILSHDGTHVNVPIHSKVGGKTLDNYKLNSFIGMPSKFEFNIEIEKYLLENDIISFERLTNTDKLPKSFIFHGVPLKIKNGDGSPVRAYAIV